MTKQEKSWILYDVANSAFALIMMTAVMPIFYKTVAAKHIDSVVSTSNWGFATSLSYLFIAVMAPILGTFADYEGRKKKFLAAFLALGVGATLLCVLVDEGDWILCLLLFSLGCIGFSGANIFYDSLLVDVTDDDKMDWVSSSGFAWGYVGGAIPFLLGIVIIGFHDAIGLDSKLTALRAVFVLTALWWLVFSAPLLRHVNQVNFIAPSLTPVRDSFARLFATVKNLRENKKAFLFLIAYFFYIDGVDTTIRMATIYGVDVGLSSETLLLVILVNQLVAFPFALLYGVLAKRFTAKKMLLAGICVYFLIIGIAYILPVLKTHEMKIAVFWSLALLVATSQGGIQALSRSYFSKLIPKEKSAEFFGFYNIFGKFAVILGPFLLGVATRLAGHPRYGVLSLALLFLIGGGLLLKVED